MAESLRVLRSDDLPEGGGRQVQVQGRSLAVFRTGGRVFAMDGTCPHRGGPLGEGALEGSIVTCPWHGWRFDVTTGACVGVPGRAQACFPARDEGGDVVVEV